MIRISEAIQTTYHRLVMANQNQISLLDVLVRPRISRSIATPVGNSSYTAGHNFGTPVGTSSYMAGQHITTHSQISRSVYSPSQAQFQTHNTRQASHPNILSVQRMASRPSSSTNRRQENQINSSASPRYVPHSYIQGKPGWRPKSDQ